MPELCPESDCMTELDAPFEHLGLYGWELIPESDGDTYCPLHAPVARLRARRTAAQDIQRAYHNERVAKKMLSAAEYRAWDEFQADLANYHRETGKLAHRELRMMNPGTWVQSYRQLGRLDIEKSCEGLVAQEKLQQERRIAYLRGI